ncbi:hypothetical protein Q7C36_008279 [Tachysurus vachellii]|uniref:Uncharacterized protein n=1 Tax=Tachysurus vachellii TaxID=175792 RepID=A0AA88SVJ8_TACVA|nr:hypothetical protein Q7C36_008279 [Tachysurus vachellii]
MAGRRSASPAPPGLIYDSGTDSGLRLDVITISQIELTVRLRVLTLTPGVCRVMFILERSSVLDTPLHSGPKVDHPSAGFHFFVKDACRASSKPRRPSIFKRRPYLKARPPAIMRLDHVSLNIIRRDTLKLWP